MNFIFNLRNRIKNTSQNNFTFHMIFSSFLTLVFALWWFCLYSPTTNEIITYKLKNTDLEKLKKESDQIFQDCSLLKKEIKELSCKFDQVCDVAKHQICEQVTWVFECASKNNILLKYCTPINTEDKEWYKKISFEMMFEGYFHQISLFIKCLLSSKLIIECQKCTIKKNNHKVECIGIFSFMQIFKNNE